MTEILLVHIEGQRFAVRKNEVESIREIGHLHRLPVSSPCIAGISIIDDRSVTLASLPACIGISSHSAGERSSVLMLSGSEKISGFVAHDDVDTISLPSDAFVPIPGCLRTDVIDICALHDSVPVPVINLHQLARQLLEPGHSRVRVLVSRPKEQAAATRFRVFELGGDLFAADAENIRDAAAEAGAIAVLPGVPAYVKGITVHESSVLAVIDLRRRITNLASENTGRMLIAGTAETEFGLLIDCDHGVRSSGEAQLMDLPPIACSSWFSKTITHAGELIPMIDLAGLLSDQEEGTAVNPDSLYRPDPSFNSLFRKQDVEVIEFSLLGARHAIPKSEVEDVIPLIPWRSIPGKIPEIVAGVALHEQNIFPVLDLAMVFGMQSPAAAGWSMIVVRSGDFRALVMTETVFGERTLPLDIQRPVPILLPHNLVYGCYPEGEAVRLVLNVEAMAVHFEKSLVRELLPLSPGMQQDTAKAAVFEVKKAEKADISAETPESVSDSPQTAVDATGFMPQEKEAISPAGEEIRTPERQHNEPAEETSSKEEPELQREPETSASTISDQTPMRETMVQDTHTPHPAAEAVQEIRTKPAEEVRSFDQTEEKPDDSTEAGNAGTEEKKCEPELLPDSFQETPTEQSVEQLPEDGSESRQSRAAISDAGDIEPCVPASAEKPEPEAVLPVEEPLIADEPAKEGASAVSFHDENLQGYRLKKWLGYAAVAAVLVFAVYGTEMLSRKGAEQQVKEITPNAEETAPAKSELPEHAESKLETAFNPRPSLVLEIPGDMVVTSEVYIVVKGDTLWGLSERFTGNPFNYPRIAGENRIADPDLIFPGQQIRLIKKQH